MVMEGLVIDRATRPVSLPAIGLRTYLEITYVGVVEEAEAGDTVYISVKVKNKYTASIYASVTVGVNGIEIQGGAFWLQPGLTYSWPMLSFVMPNRSVYGTVGAYYSATTDGAEWVKDDEQTFTVGLLEEVGWQLLDSMALGINAAVPPPVGWQLLDSKTITITPTPPPPVGWQLLDSKTLNIASGPLPPEYELIQHVIEPWAYFYEGPAEIGSIVFTLPIGTTWIAKEIANNFADELKKNGSTLLEGKFYKDASDLITDRYRVDITAALPATGTIGWAIPWTLIGWAAFAALVAFIIYWAVNWVKSVTFSPKPLSEDVKAQWERDTLISMITDLRPGYSPEELEGMTDRELRDVLDEIYEEEVKPGINWWWVAIIGGMSLAGAGIGLSAYKTFTGKK